MKIRSIVLLMTTAACTSDAPIAVDAGPPPSRSFATDVYPLMSELACASCHTVGATGYEMSPARGGLKADFSGTAEQVRTVLLAGATADCATASTRVCMPVPEASLFYTKPLLETGVPPNHPGVSFPEGTTVLVVILGWIRNGAQP
jgi:hypothetical protein